MTVPRLIGPFVRTRVRLTCTLSLLLLALVAALTPWRHSEGDTAAQPTAVSATRDEAAAMAEARRTGEEVLIDTATTATTLSWALPTGELRTTVHATPQRAVNSAGEWAPIDTALARTPETTDGLGISPANAPFPLRLSNGTAPTAGLDQQVGKSTQALRLPAVRNSTAAGNAERPETVLAELDLDGHLVTYTWPGLLPEPVLDGARALYPEVLPGVDLLTVAREEGGFGQLLIVKENTAATIDAVRSLTYGLRSETAVFRHDATTAGVQILDPTNQEEIGSIPSPFAWDSSATVTEAPGATPRTAVTSTEDVLHLSGLAGAEPGARHAPIPTSLDGDGTGNARFHLDAAATGLLTDPDARFPLFLDPTVKGGTTAWATVYKQHPNTNTWNGTNFNSGTSDARVGYEQRTPLLTRSFWRMSYPAALRGSTVHSATFKILNNHSWSCQTREMRLNQTGAISSGTTWNSQPAWQTVMQRVSFAYGYGSACANDYVSFNVKAGAVNASAGNWSNITFGMAATTETDTYTWRKFAATSAELTVVHNRTPNEPTGGTSSPGGACVTTAGSLVVAKTNIVLSARATDPDGNLKGLRFRFWKTGGTVPAGTLVTATSTGTASLTIAASTLEDKATYSWDVRAEDSFDTPAVSTYFPPGTDPCRLTIDASAPPAPTVTSTDFPEATPDGATWAKVRFGQTGKVTLTATGAVKFSYSFNTIRYTDITANASGQAVVSNLAPRHAGPNTLTVYAYDAVGNKSVRTDYVFYVPPGAVADSPGDLSGDGRPDLLLINSSGNLRSYPGDVDGELYGSLVASYNNAGTANPTGHWYDPVTGKAALISKYSDVYPGDGITDLFARTPDGGFWIYPGDGYGSFNVDQRLRVLLPDGTPDPATWTQIKAIGDVTGDGRPDLVLRTADGFWALSGYTGAGFQEAILMSASAWGIREIVNLADIDLDGTPDLLWRNVENGNMYVRHGKPGAIAGSVDLTSLRSAANSRDGDVAYGTSWTGTNITAVIGIPDVNGDNVPDLWARVGATGQIRIYHPSTTNTRAAVGVVISSDWSTVKAFG